MKKCLLTLSLIILTVALAMAQRSISGVVTDVDGEALIGANVVAKGTTVGTVTGLDGDYQLNVPEGTEAIMISYTGYSTQEITLGASNILNVSLDEGSVLDEIVVTAIGIERNARNVVYANQTVKADELMRNPSKNALEALRGKTAGVQLTTGSGSIGASTKIVLRGPGTLTGNNNALIVVDGIPIDNSTSSGGAETSTGGYADHGNRFNDMNPDDIETVTILKGPSATALYGSRGSSGVIMITTKKGGGKDGNMKVGLNFSASQERAYVLLQRQDQFGQGFDNAHYDSGENWSWGPAFTGENRPWTSPVDTDGDGALESLVRPYSAVPNQLEEFFNYGSTRSTGVNLSGSNKGFNFYASYSNTDQKGIIDNTSYKRNTFTFNAGAKLSDKVSSNFKISYAGIEQNTAQEGSRAFEGNNAYAMAVQSPVNIPFGELRDYNSPFHDINGYWGSYSSVNPYLILNEYGNLGNINNILGNVSVTYQMLPGLSLTGKLGSNIVTTGIQTWTPSYTPATQLVWTDGFELVTRGSRHSSIGEYVNYKKQKTNVDATVYLNYTTDLTVNGDWTFDATAGYNNSQTEINRITGETKGGLVVPGWYNLDNSAEASKSTEYSSRYRLYGVLANARFGYKNGLFFDVSARNDWSSTLPVANNSFFYSAFGASAILTDLMDIQSNTLSFLKLRGSYGTSGKDAGLHLLQSSFIGNPVLQDLGDFSIDFPLNGQAGFTTSNVIGNPNLKPELTTTFEIGADIGMFDDRINIAYTYYSANHSDQIVEVKLPKSSGFDETSTNIGEMTNKGHELTLSVKPIANTASGFSWELFTTYAKNTNEVVKISEGIDELIIATYGTPGVTIGAKEGLPFGSFKALSPQMTDDGQVIVDATTGFPLYTADEEYIGAYQPDFTVGFGTNIGYKGLGFNILFDMRQGGNFISQTQFFTEFNGTATHTSIHNREAYVFPNSVYEDADGNMVANDIEITEQDYFTSYDPAGSTYLVDASYVKLREIGLSYDLPSSLLSTMPVSGVRISLFAKNVKFWLADGNTFADPEIGGPDLTGNANGLETTQTPPSRSFGINLNLTF